MSAATGNSRNLASHDLREPLRKVQAFGERLEAKYTGALGDQERDYLQRMREAATRMQRLIDDLLAFSRIATRAKPFVSTNLDTIAGNVVEDLESLIEESNGSMELGELGEILADPTQIRQLLQNLIANGLKFHREDVPPVVKVSRDCNNSGG